MYLLTHDSLQSFHLVFSSLTSLIWSKLNVPLNVQTLEEDEPEKYQSHFIEYIKKGLDADGLEEMYKKVHAAIRADPTQKKSEKQPPKEHKR